MLERRRTAGAVDDVAKEMADVFDLAGLAVGIVHEGETTYADGFGVLSLEKGTAVTPDSMFRMASVTKPFVATAVMQLVEQRRVQLDAPLVEFLPYFRLADERYQHITVRHLLNHTSGLPRSCEEPEPDDDREGYLRRSAGARLDADPGERFGYSNLGYEVLGEIVARASGLSFEDYLETRVLAPVHMHTSTFRPERVDTRLEALPHLNGPHPILGPVVPQHSVHAPSGGLISNVTEMCNWAIANLNKGQFGGEQILDASSYGDLWGTAPPQGESAAGLGWFVGEHRGHRRVQHGGTMTGYQTSLILVPDLATAVVVLTNSHPVPAEAIAVALLDTVLGHTPEPARPLVLHEIYPTLMHEGRQAAIEKYEALKVDRPDDYDFNAAQFYQVGWANLLTALKMPKEAIEVIELAVAIHADSDAYHHLLALAYDEFDDRAQAIRCLERCLALNPDHQGATEMLARMR